MNRHCKKNTLKNKDVHVRVSEIDYVKIAEAAKNDESNISAFMRRIIRRSLYNAR